MLCVIAKLSKGFRLGGGLIVKGPLGDDII